MGEGRGGSGCGWVGAAAESAASYSREENPYLYYEKWQRVGKGTFGDVFRVVCTADGSEVAVKKVRPGLTEKEKNQVELEIAIMQQRYIHANLLKCTDSFIF